jgi:hypothetical protein
MHIFLDPLLARGWRDRTTPLGVGRQTAANPHRVRPRRGHPCGQLHFNITQHPTTQWTAQQIVEAFPWNEAPRYLLRDRDSIYGKAFQKRVGHMGIEEVKIAPL